MPLRHGHDPLQTAPTATTTDSTDAAFDTIPSARVSHVLLVDRKQRLILSRLRAPGLPHGGQLTSSVVANVEGGESYEMAAVRGLRALFGRRAPELRYVDRTWIDRDGGRTWIDVYVALYDGDVPSGHVAVPIGEVLSAARLDDRGLEGAFVRALRAVHGDAAVW